VALSGEKLVATATQVDTQNTAGTTTSTTFTATLTGGTACGTTFIAPPSGRVLIFNNLAMLNSGANFCLCGVQVRAGGSIGSGTIAYAVSDNDAVTTGGTTEFGLCRVSLVTGLTAGSTYNVQQLFRVTAGTGTFERKHLVAQPQV